MTVQRDGDVIRLRGNCTVEDAEPLLDLLLNGASAVDLDGCGRLHTAVVQVLWAARPRVSGVPMDAFILTWILPMLATPAEGVLPE